MTEWYFVWVEGLRGPMPQKWSSDGLWGQVGRQDVIVRFTLSDAEAHLPLDELARLHPVPDGSGRWRWGRPADEDASTDQALRGAGPRPRGASAGRQNSTIVAPSPPSPR